MKPIQTLYQLCTCRKALSEGGYVNGNGGLKGEISDISVNIRRIQAEIADISMPEYKLENAWDALQDALGRMDYQERVDKRHPQPAQKSKKLTKRERWEGEECDRIIRAIKYECEAAHEEYLRRVEILDNWYGMRDKLQRELDAAKDSARDYIALMDKKIAAIMPKAGKEAQALGVDTSGLDAMALLRAVMKAGHYRQSMGGKFQRTEGDSPKQAASVSLKPHDWIDGCPIFRGADIQAVFAETRHEAIVFIHNRANWHEPQRIMPKTLYSRFKQAMGFAPDVLFTPEGLIIEHGAFKARVVLSTVYGRTTKNPLWLHISEEAEAITTAPKPSRRALRTLEGARAWT